MHKPRAAPGRAGSHFPRRTVCPPPLLSGILPDLKLRSKRVEVSARAEAIATERHGWNGLPLFAAFGRAVELDRRQDNRVRLQAWVWAIVRVLVRSLFILCFRGRAFGLNNVPKSGAVVLASNHQSYLDPPLLACPLDRQVTFMARASLFRSRLFGGLIRTLNAFPVERGKADREAVRAAVRRLEDGWCLLLFPEGTRTRTGEIGPLKSGVLSIADRAKAPIVPTVIAGAFEAWPRHSGISPRPISIWYGRPISYEARRHMSREELAEALHARMSAGYAALKMRRQLACFGRRRSGERNAPDLRDRNMGTGSSDAARAAAAGT